MVFKVFLDPKAAKALRKLDNANGARMRKALEELKVDPWKAGKPLRPSNFWGLRSGDYRAIYEIDRAKKRVIILFAGHRKKVYDDFSKLL